MAEQYTQRCSLGQGEASPWHWRGKAGPQVEPKCPRQVNIHQRTSHMQAVFEEDLDQILNLEAESKPKPQPQPKLKPPVAAKPAIPRKPALPPKAGPSEAVAGQQKPQEQIQAMDEMDILQYIQEHAAPAQATPSLF
ncbi:HCLS1-binding protein 3 [Saguinus oedipus]|uniref:HCLS1-binding protein 3 n=1 Tax=Saguinus oedipus TaxID=9490 RepID=A0ABQ9U5E9_SAGOE|nr:HCLS1-binding protein 3 [Saguinus oedipus]